MSKEALWHVRRVPSPLKVHPYGMALKALREGLAPSVSIGSAGQLNVARNQAKAARGGAEEG